MESKINVLAKDGKVLVGSDFHTLQDFSEKKFSTSSFEDFVAYCAKLESEGYKGLCLYYTSTTIAAYESDITRYSVPIATCNFSASEFVKRLKMANNASMSLEQFGTFLKEMKSCMDGNGLAVLSTSQDFKINKVSKITRSKGRDGNINYSYTRESTGKDDFMPPESITFRVPVFEFLDDEREFSFEFEFDYKENDGVVTTMFKLTNSRFETILRDFQKEIIMKNLEPVKWPKYWGSLSIETMTDEWKFKKNQI
jgi:hypothetical protein